MGPEQSFPRPEGPTINFWEVVREKSLVIIGFGTIAFGSLYLLEHFRPNQSNTNLAGIITAVFLTLLTYLKSEQSHLTMNQRMTEWMKNAEKVAENRGYALAIEELEKRVRATEERHHRQEQEAILDRATATAIVTKAKEEASLVRDMAFAATPVPPSSPAAEPTSPSLPNEIIGHIEGVITASDDPPSLSFTPTVKEKPVVDEKKAPEDSSKKP